MVQVHVTPRGGERCSLVPDGPTFALGPAVLARGDDPPEPPVPGFARRGGSDRRRGPDVLSLHFQQFAAAAPALTPLRPLRPNLSAAPALAPGPPRPPATRHHPRPNVPMRRSESRRRVHDGVGAGHGASASGGVLRSGIVRVDMGLRERFGHHRPPASPLSPNDPP